MEEYWWYSTKKTKKAGDCSSKLDLEGAGGGGGSEYSSNPLVNDVVVSNLMGLCDKGDLARVRLVSKLWHQRSLKRFRQSATVVHDMKGDGSREDHLIKVLSLPGGDTAAGRGSDENLSIEVDSELLEKCNLRSCPYRNFKLKNWKFELKHMEQSFWKECGGGIQTLTLTNCTFREGPTLDLLLEKCPSLESIIFDNVKFGYFFPDEVEENEGEEAEVDVNLNREEEAEANAYSEEEVGEEEVSEEEVGEVEVGEDEVGEDEVDVDEEDEAEAIEVEMDEDEEVELDDSEDDEDPVRVPFELPVRQHPSVKSVEIRWTPCNSDRLNIGFEILGPILPYLFPNLERIRLSAPPGPPLEQFHILEVLLTRIRNIRKEDPSTFGITSLDIVDLKIWTRHLVRVANLLNELKFPLKSLSIDLMSIYSQEDVRRCKSILLCHSSTLTKLEIKGYLNSVNDPDASKFPWGIPMNSLRELMLRDPLLKNVSYLEHFPNLTTFECASRLDMDGELIIMDANTLLTFRLPYLTTFKFLLFQPSTPTNLEVLAECMPNLKEIWMQANADTFPALCSLWKNSLRKLHVAFGDNSLDEYVILGIGRTFSIARISTSPRRPNITDVKGLEEFEMYHIRSTKRGSKYLDQQPPRLTYLSFREGFCRLPSLRKLSLVISTKSETDNIVRELEGKGFDVQIARDDNYNLCVKASHGKIM